MRQTDVLKQETAHSGVTESFLDKVRYRLVSNLEQERLRLLGREFSAFDG